MQKQTAVLLHDVRSAHNVGSIFRTCDAAGVSRIFLAGITPAPKDKFGRVKKEIVKTALGADQYIPWEKHISTLRLLRALKKEDWHIVGVEQDASAKSYRTFRQRGKTVFIFGNEVQGLPKKVRNECHALIEIPMRGKKESLNVSVAAGIILFSIQ